MIPAPTFPAGRYRYPESPAGGVSAPRATSDRAGWLISIAGMNASSASPIAMPTRSALRYDPANDSPIRNAVAIGTVIHRDTPNPSPTPPPAANSVISAPTDARNSVPADSSAHHVP